MKPHSRPIDTVVIHCSATPEGRFHTMADVRAWHITRGFSDIGYHYVLWLDGKIEKGRSEDRQGAHARTGGHNDGTLGVCYIGGMDADNKHPKDTRTPAQKAALRELLDDLADQYGPLKVIGHRDIPGVSKACPSFDAAAEYGPVWTGGQDRDPGPFHRMCQTAQRWLRRSR